MRNHSLSIMRGGAKGICCHGHQLKISASTEKWIANLSKERVSFDLLHCPLPNYTHVIPFMG